MTAGDRIASAKQLAIGNGRLAMPLIKDFDLFCRSKTIANRQLPAANCLAGGSLVLPMDGPLFLPARQLAIGNG
jgi:hypothetical protein